MWTEELSVGEVVRIYCNRIRGVDWMVKFGFVFSGLFGIGRDL